MNQSGLSQIMLPHAHFNVIGAILQRRGFAIALWFFAAGCALDQRSPERPAVDSSLSETRVSPTVTDSEVQAPAPTPQGDSFEAALDSAASAVTLSQSAFSAEDWQLVVNRWQRAIDLLKQVPQASSNYVLAQTKLQEYQRNLADAQQRVQQPTPTRSIEVRPGAMSSTSASRSFSEICTERDRLSEAAQQTVDAVLNRAGTSDCDEAGETLESMTELDLSRTGISDLSPLQSLTALTHLDLSFNTITDLKPLQALTNLEELSLSNNQIRDIAPLRSLTTLTTLSLNNNQVAEITPLAELTSLETLHLSNNQITNIEPLAALTALNVLSLNSNQIKEVSSLQSLTKLNSLFLNGNPLSSQTCPVQPASICQF